MDALSAEDQEHLDALEKQLSIVRDLVACVADGASHGLLLYGEGGIGKSYTVVQKLTQLKANYKVSNSRMTGRGLYDVLEQRPDAVHVLEDMEGLFSDRAAQGVLRSALWGQDPTGDGFRQRIVTWTTHKDGDLRFEFTGGIIMTANRPLDDLPELRAMATRIDCLHLTPTQDQLRALMRWIALQGYAHDGQRLEPAACSQVCEFVIQESLGRQWPLDVRVLENGFRKYITWEQSGLENHWQDVVLTCLLRHVQPKRIRETRPQKLAREREIAKRIAETTTDKAQRIELWEKETGLKKSAFYDRLAETDFKEHKASEQPKSRKVGKSETAKGPEPRPAPARFQKRGRDERAAG